MQDNAFFKIAQCNAIYRYMQEMSTLNLCCFSVNDKLTRRTLLNMAKSLGARLHIAKKMSLHRKNFKTKLLELINQNALLGGALQLAIWFKDSVFARFKLRHLGKRFQGKHDFMFVSYFPNIDETAAKEGAFINKYCEALQKELEENQKEITWLLMPVFYNGHRFNSSVNLAKTFIEKGEKLFLLQEFFTLRLFFKSIGWWLRQALLSEILLLLLPKQSLTHNLTHKEMLPFLHYMWRHSFMGISGIRGIIFYLTYSEVFKRLPNVKNCLYYCEMQAWEKALNLAKSHLSPDTFTYAFQHTVVMRNYFNYFYIKKK